MSRELNKTTNKIVTDRLVREIQIGIIADRDIPNLNAKKAHDFWETNKQLIIGLSVEELVKILRSSNNKTSMAKQYEAIMASMSWRERIDFMRQAEEDLIKAKNKRYNTAIFIARLMEISLKVLPIVLAAL